MALEASFSRYRKAIILVVLVVLIVVGGFAWAYSTHTGGKVVGDSVPISITALHSDVFVKEAQADFVSVPGQATTTSGSTIRTSETGRALIESSAAHRTLVDYSSEIVLNETANHTEVGLVTGAVWSRLAKVFDSGEDYEVKSPNAVAAVRGTSFGMWYSEGQTVLIVTEGSVAFSVLDLDTGLPIHGTEVIVTAGHKAVCGRDGVIVVTELTTMDYALPWVVFNTTDSKAIAPLPATPTVAPAPGAVVPATASPITSAAPVSGPEISIVSPSSINAGSRELITIKGKNLANVNLVTVGSQKVHFEILDAFTISFTAQSIAPGIYDVTVTGGGGASDTNSRGLTVNEVATSTQAPPRSPNGAP